MKTRELAYCGLFGALALALPTLFHALGPVGPMLLPMYWPLVTLAFLVSTRRAAFVAACVPWVSACLTGMPLLWPPLAAVLSLELAVQVGLIGAFGRVRGDARGGVPRVVFVLGLVLALGRLLHAGLVWLLAGAFPNLPAGVLAGASFLAGWPGVVAMLAFVPVFVGSFTRRDGVCEVRFLKALRRLHLPEGVVLVCAQTLRWFEALSRDAEMLARALELRRGGGAGAEAARAETAIRMRGVEVRYPGASEPALRIESLDVRSGERIALLGPNGSGKTTLLSLLAGFVDYTGEVAVCGREPKKARRRLGVLFENPDDQFLFPTVREDVGHALEGRGLPREEIERRIDGLLLSLGLPTGNRPVAALSRGQRQRAALAGVLAAEPEVLLLDEPTAALDDAERTRLAEVLKACPAAMLIATHDRAFAAALCPRTVEMP
ncbi:MAG: energy-coupling factor ABC transporter ATP-binding protein [Kiritimatiellia bacterium]